MSWLQPKPGGYYVDGTLGAGGMALRILEQSQPDGLVIGIDRDPEAIAMARECFKESLHRVRLFHGNFSHLASFVTSAGGTRVDGIVFDLGVSSAQLDRAERGFSFLADGPLDMRMDPTSGQTAAELLTRLTETELVKLLREYGEERYARRIARAVTWTRQQEPIQTTSQLSAVIRKAVPPPYRHGRLHYATRTFQAIRIAVNQELDVLERALYDAAGLLIPGGRLCVISFHSLEDRIVKHTFRALSHGPDPMLTTLTRKPCTPSDTERKNNPRARSAKLRVAERLAEGGGR